MIANFKNLHFIPTMPVISLQIETLFSTVWFHKAALRACNKFQGLNRQNWQSDIDVSNTVC